MHSGLRDLVDILGDHVIMIDMEKLSGTYIKY